MKLQTIIGEVDVRFRYGFREAKAPVCAVRAVDCDLRAPGWTSDVWRGGATCDSRSQFVKATGRKIALAKAMRDAGLPRHIRAEVWYRYHHTVRGGDAFALDAALRFAGQALRKGQPLGFMAQKHLPSPAERAGLLA